MSKVLKLNDIKIRFRDDEIISFKLKDFEDIEYMLFDDIIGVRLLERNKREYVEYRFNLSAVKYYVYNKK